jgi:hypothetical protein
MRTSLTRAVAGVAIAATAVLAAVGTAGVASATTNAPTTKSPTTLTLVDAKASIHLGQKDLLTGTLKSGSTPLANRVVSLKRDVKGTWVFIEAGHTGGLGHVFFPVQPATTTAYKVFFAGGPKYLASSSNVVIVKVIVPVKKSTILSIGATKSKIKPGQSSIVFGTLTNGSRVPLAGQLVWLSTFVKGKWVLGFGHYTGKFGGVDFKVTPAATTAYKLVFQGTVKYLASHSGVVTVVVS